MLEADWRLGLAISKKIGPSVVRNYFKRRIRECFRIHQEMIPNALDIVVVAKHHLKEVTLKSNVIAQDILFILHKVGTVDRYMR